MGEAHAIGTVIILIVTAFLSGFTRKPAFLIGGFLLGWLWPGMVVLLPFAAVVGLGWAAQVARQRLAGNGGV
jgi:hypothetical protein